MHVRCKLKKAKGKGTLLARRFDGQEATDLRFGADVHRVDPGDWILHDDEHDFSVVSAATFEKSYTVTQEIPPVEAGR